jgi:hypothetical protein
MLLHLLSLGIFLKMKKEYFYVLLSNLKIIWDKKLFDNPLWTRDKFSFHVLEKIVPLRRNTMVYEQRNKKGYSA